MSKPSIEFNSGVDFNMMVESPSSQFFQPNQNWVDTNKSEELKYGVWSYIDQNTDIIWSLPQGDSRFRVCPPWSRVGDISFCVYHAFTKLEGEEKGKSIVLPTTYASMGVECPLTAEVNLLLNEGFTADEIKPVCNLQTNYFINAWELDEQFQITNYVPKVVKVGKEINNELVYNFEKGRDFTNPQTGCPVVITRTGTKMEDTKYRVFVSIDKPSAICDDPAQIPAWAAQIHNLYLKFPCPHPNPNIADQAVKKMMVDSYNRLTEVVAELRKLRTRSMSKTHIPVNMQPQNQAAGAIPVQPGQVPPNIPSSVGSVPTIPQNVPPQPTVPQYPPQNVPPQPTIPQNVPPQPAVQQPAVPPQPQQPEVPVVTEIPQQPAVPPQQPTIPQNVPPQPPMDQSSSSVVMDTTVKDVTDQQGGSEGENPFHQTQEPNQVPAETNGLPPLNGDYYDQMAQLSVVPPVLNENIIAVNDDYLTAKNDDGSLRFLSRLDPGKDSASERGIKSHISRFKNKQKKESGEKPKIDQLKDEPKVDFPIPEPPSYDDSEPVAKPDCYFNADDPQNTGFLIVSKIDVTKCIACPVQTNCKTESSRFVSGTT